MESSRSHALAARRSRNGETSWRCSILSRCRQCGSGESKRPRPRPCTLAVSRQPASRYANLSATTHLRSSTTTPRQHGTTQRIHNNHAANGLFSIRPRPSTTTPSRAWADRPAFSSSNASAAAAAASRATTWRVPLSAWPWPAAYTGTSESASARPSAWSSGAYDGNKSVFDAPSRPSSTPAAKYASRDAATAAGVRGPRTEPDEATSEPGYASSREQLSSSNDMRDKCARQAI